MRCVKHVSCKFAFIVAWDCKTWHGATVRLMANRAPSISVTLRGGTAAALAQALHEEGPEAVLRELGGHKVKVAGKHSVITPREAIEVRRRDNPDADSYHDYSPPPLWQPAYQILRVQLMPTPKSGFMHHSGEEIVVPVSGKGVVYSFLRPTTGRFALEREVIKPLAVGEIMRTQPSVPHHTWSVDDPAEAWMVFRDLSFSAMAIRCDPQSILGLNVSGLKARAVDKEFFEQNPEVYCMAAFGVAEQIRYLRAKVGLPITELADMAGIDRAQLSRIESGQANVGVEKLMRIGDLLGFDPFDAFLHNLWVYERRLLESAGQDHPKGRKSANAVYAESPDISKAQGRHYLHPTFYRVPAGQRHRIGGPDTKSHAEMPLDSMESWIVLEGAAFFDMTVGGGSQRAYVQAGSVLHLREPLETTVQAVEPTKLLRLTFSPLCICHVRKSSPV